MKRNELVGQRFGKLVVQNLHSISRNGHTRWVCLCDCGNTHNILGTHLITGKTTSCGCHRNTRAREFLGEYVGEISGNFWFNHIIRGANGGKGRRIIELTITREYAWNLFLQQERRCALTNILLYFPRVAKEVCNVSLDRINSGLGYIVGNVQWVHKDVNRMKNAYAQEYFIQMCKLVTQHNNACEVE